MEVGGVIEFGTVDEEPTGSWEILAAEDQPACYTKTKRGHKVTHVLDSGAERRTWAQNLIPRVKLDKTKYTEVPFRVAHGQLYPTWGRSSLKGRLVMAILTR